MRRKLLIALMMIMMVVSACGAGESATAPDAAPELPVEPTLAPATISPTDPPAVEPTAHLPVAIPQLPPEGAYDIGSPALTEVWVDPATGDDSRDGSTREQALRTLSEAWERIPQGVELTTGYRILLAAGAHPEDTLPNYLESRYGTAGAPILITAADGPGTATLGGDLNIYDTRYLYLIDLNIIPNPPGDVIHCEKCDHFLIRNAVLDGGGEAHETLKANQSQYLFIENSDISGTYENAIDYVAVQYGHILNNRIHGADDWCAYVKGGSAYIRVEGNEIYDCGTGGFTAGQGTGFQYMVAPWLAYEAYDVKVINNVIHDTEGAGLGVNGGYNILFAYNTLYRVGQRSHALEFVFGLRSCDGQPGDEGRERCDQNLAAGGWGTTVVDDGTNAVLIPNKNIFVYNNLLYNPPGYRSEYQNFAIFGPNSAPTQTGSNAPAPALADENLQIRGNLIWDGGPDHALGIEGSDQGCQPSNPTCNADQLRADNAINTVEPQLANPGGGDFRPAPGGNVFGVTTFAIPDFAWDVNAPAGNLSNSVAADRGGSSRPQPGPPGAYVGGN